jgi:lipopolysaccharide cholinephosphotransferase
MPRFKASIMDSYIKVPFEGYEFSAIQNYDEVLTKMYGNYMQLPPEDKRIPHHNFEAFWID